MAEPGITGTIERLVEPRLARDVAHQHEHRNHGKVVGEPRLVSRLAEQGEARAAIDQEQRTQKAAQPHGEAQRHAAGQQHKEQAEDQEGDDRGRHESLY